MKANIFKSYALTQPQLDIFLHQFQLPDCPLYNICGYTKLLGEPDIKRLQTAYQHLTNTFDVFKLKFSIKSELPEQKLQKEVNYQLQNLDLTHCLDVEAAAKGHLTDFFQTKFDLSNGQLFRGKIITLSKNEHWFAYTGHHLIVDGWAVSHIVRRLGELYSALGKGAEKQVLLQFENMASFVDILDNEAKYLNSKAYLKAQNYWCNKFVDIPEPLLQPHYRDYFSSLNVVPSKRQQISLSSKRVLQLINFTETHQIGIQNVFIGLVYCYFSACSLNEDMVIGMPVHNRTNATKKEIIGLFASMSPVRLNFSRESDFLTLLLEINKSQRQDFRHQKFPISHLNRLINSGEGQKPLFDLCFNYLKLDINAKYDELQTETRFVGHGFSQIPLSVNILEFGKHQDLEIQVDYNLAYWSDEESALLLQRFNFILEQVLIEPEKKISEYSIIPSLEHQFLVKQHHTNAHLDLDGSVSVLFEHFAEQKPNELAVIFGEKEMSFSELNHKSNQLAHYLVAQEVGANTRVGICFSPSIDMIISLLAVFKVGATYVPFDANFPQSRLDFMIKDSNIKYLLTESHYQRLFQHFPHKVIYLDNLEQDQVLSQFSISNLQKITEFSLSSSAYVIYTSGSTGQPKGVIVNHGNLMNYVQGVKLKHHIPEGLSYGVLSTLATDLGNTSIYLALTTGGNLHMLPEQISRDSVEFSSYLNQHKLDVLKLTPNHFDALYEEALFHSTFPCRYLFLGGEALLGSALDKVLLLAKQSQSEQTNSLIINHYGPTEATIGCLTHEINPNVDYLKMPIGSPLPNIQIYILNDEKKQVPVGCIGELYIGGSGVSDGYLNHNGLTKKSFISTGFEFEIESPVYRTGDLVRCLDNGELEFIGRNDDQVKIRGYRVELGEIEFQLTQLNQVEAAVVQLKENLLGTEQLIAYISLSNQSSKNLDWHVDSDAFRLELNKTIPSHMIPDQFIVLDEFPLTPNGKIDKKALPEIDLVQQEVTYVAPSTNTEIALCEVWQDILGLDRIGITDNFFQSGGNSLLSMRVNTKIKQIFNVSITMSLFFNTPTIEVLAMYVDTSIKLTSNEITNEIEEIEEGLF